MKIVVLGCGYVGGAFAKLAMVAGHELWAVRRSLGEPPAAGVHRVCADVTTGAGLEELPRNADALVYAVSPGDRSDDAYRAAYPEAVRRVLTEVPTPRFLLVSSTSVYGDAGGGWVDEETPTAPANFSGQRILEAEQHAASAVRATAIVRASGIYGPGRTSLLERVRHGEAVTPEQPVFTNRIHRDDLAAILLFLVERPALNGVLLATDTEPAALAQLHSWLAARLGVPEPPVVAGGVPRARHRLSRRCMPRRLLAEGYSFRFPSFREGYAAILDGSRAR